MPKNIFTGEEVSKDNPNAALLTGTGFSGQFSAGLLPPEEKQEQYVAENLQAFTEKAESEEGLTGDDIIMTARSFIDGLWFNKSDEAGSYMAATAVYILNPEMRDKSIPQIADEMQLGLEAESARFAEESPWAAGISNVAGSVLSPVSLATGGVLSQAAKLRSGAQAGKAVDEVGASLGGAFARTGADDAAGLAAQLGRQQAGTRVFGVGGDATGALAQTLSKANPMAALGVTGGVVGLEGAVIGAEGDTWAEKAKNAAFTAGISAAVPFAFAGLKKTYDFATESKMAQQLGSGANFTNLMFTEHGLSQVYRSVISKAYGGRTLSEQQARQVAGRAAPAAAARKAVQEVKEESKNKVANATAAIKRNTVEAIEETGLRLDDQIVEVNKLAAEARGAQKIEYEDQLALLTEAKNNVGAAKALAVKEADASVNAANAGFRGQALRESAPSGTPQDEINALGALDPQDANVALDDLWRKYGFKVADGKTYTINKDEVAAFIDSIADEYSDLVLVGAEKGGIINAVKKYVVDEIGRKAPDGVIKGEDLLQLRSTIGRAINGLSDGSVSTRRFSSEVQAHFHDLLESGLNAAERKTFASDRAAWGVRSTVDEATVKASGGDARAGAFTGSDYLNALRSFSPRFSARGGGRLQKEAQELAAVTERNKQNILDLAESEAQRIGNEAIRDKALLRRQFEITRNKLNAKEAEEIAAIRKDKAVNKASEQGKEIIRLRIAETKEKYALQLANLDAAAAKAKNEMDSLKTLMPSNFKGSVFENLFNTAITGQAVTTLLEPIGLRPTIGATLLTGFGGAKVLSQEITQRILARQTPVQQGLREFSEAAGQALESRGITAPVAQAGGAVGGTTGQFTTPQGVMFDEERKETLRKLPTSGKAALYRNLKANKRLDRLEAEDPKLFKELERAYNAGRN
jgi:hypothetical protein